MIVGVNEKLERMIRSYRDGDDRVDFDEVMDCVVESVAVGDCWYVTADILAEGMNGTDIDDGLELGDFPLFKRTLKDRKSGEVFFCAFTCEDEIRGEEDGDEMITVRYAAKALLRDLLEAEDCAGVVINPWTDDFIISKKNAELVLELAEEMPPEAVRALQTVRLEPAAVIDTNEITAAWRDGWHDDEKTEDWKLETYPVMADGRVLLVFSMADRYYTKADESVEIMKRYRVLEYGIADGKAELLNRYRFSGQSMDVGTVTLYDGVLRAAVTVPDSDAWKMLQMHPNDDGAQFALYSDIETMVSDSRGRVIAAYTKNLHDAARCPLMVFGSDGEVAARYSDRNALACRDVNLDSDENIWFSMYPSATLDVLDEKKNAVVSHKAELNGFDAFALSTDRSRLFVHFSEKDGGSVQYVMRADENGDYVDPVRFDFRPEDADGNVLAAKDCEVFGKMSSNKNTVVLNADGRLYVYDIDGCCE